MCSTRQLFLRFLMSNKISSIRRILWFSVILFGFFYSGLNIYTNIQTFYKYPSSVKLVQNVSQYAGMKERLAKRELIDIAFLRRFKENL